MAIDVTIKQKLFGNKKMPLEEIIGENLYYGTFENEQISVGELGDTEFIAYNPEHIGRGFSVIWNPKEKKSIELRQPIPTTKQELTDFYAAIERMVKYWNATLIIDGNKTSLDDFMAGLGDMVEFNDRVIKKTAQEVIDGEHDVMTFYSAMLPLGMGKEEAQLFVNDTDKFADWLHEKQEIDACFASPRFFAEGDSIIGKVLFANDLPTVFRKKPEVPFYAINPSTGKALECDSWKVLICIKDGSELVKELDYSEFFECLPSEKVEKFDGDKVLVSAMNDAEIKALFKD